jgi:acetylornithine/succinyldiaminopimelate/putrescine aminotransferase
VGFDLAALLSSRGGQGASLHRRHLNRQVPRLLHGLDFERAYVSGRGSYLYDADGRRYLDFLAGFGVFAVGRDHPTVRAALHQALDAGLADMVQFDVPLLPGLLAEQLLARTPGLDRVYWCNSGSEAVEAALKFARRATGRGRVLFCDHGYHGLTAGALSANGGAEFRRGFGPLLPGTQLPLGDLAALRRELRRGDVAALVVEPIQGKGVHIAPPGYLRAAADLLHEHGALLICDEVQTGIGRTGELFGYQHDGVEPDIVAVAKALSGGYVPIGATLAKEWIVERVYGTLDRVFVHASTFAGNALAMTAGLATLTVLDDEDLLGNAARQGERLRAGLSELAGRYELLTDVRGRGLMIGIEFGKPRTRSLRLGWQALELAHRGLFAQLVVGPLFHQHRVLTQVAGDHMNVIKLLPPLVAGEEEVDEFLAAFADVMDQAHRGMTLARRYGRTLLTQAVTR